MTFVQPRPVHYVRLKSIAIDGEPCHWYNGYPVHLECVVARGVEL